MEMCVLNLLKCVLPFFFVEEAGSWSEMIITDLDLTCQFITDPAENLIRADPDLQHWYLPYYLPYLVTISFNLNCVAGFMVICV